MPEFQQSLTRARELSWQQFGKKITFYLPGMFVFNNMTGHYPALSITGTQCSLMCDHCKGKILTGMIDARNPGLLVKRCRELERKGVVGVLLSGGCDSDGQLPWKHFLGAVEKVKNTTGLLVSVHSGFVSKARAREMKQAGVDQVLIDIIGDDDTFREIYHLPDGIRHMEQSLEALCEADVEMVPHIVCGLHHGKIKGEPHAVAIISRFPVNKLVIVSLMGIPGTPAFRTTPPTDEAVVKIIIKARLEMPHTQISLGCARQRGNSQLEVLAIQAGITSLALPSDEAIDQAKAYDLAIGYQKTCCSVPADFSNTDWDDTTVQ